MNSKELTKYHFLRAVGKHKDYKVYFFVEKPNICAVLLYKDAKVYKGFSKVSWPDEWNETTGKGIALKRAVRRLARDERRQPRGPYNE